MEVNIEKLRLRQAQWEDMCFDKMKQETSEADERVSFNLLITGCGFDNQDEEARIEGEVFSRDYIEEKSQGGVFWHPMLSKKYFFTDPYECTGYEVNERELGLLRRKFNKE